MQEHGPSGMFAHIPAWRTKSKVMIISVAGTWVIIGGALFKT